MKEKKERAYAIGYTLGLNSVNADQPYNTPALAQAWQEGLRDGKNTYALRIAEFKRLRALEAQ